MRRGLTACAALAATLALSGCGAMSAVGAVADVASSALEAAGLKKPKDAPWDVDISIHAGNNLNASGGQSMALVTKVYYLKNSEAFLRAPMQDFIDPERAKATLGDALVGTRELPLTPGQKYQAVEKVPREATAVGLVALFHSPAPQRWKFVFDTKKAEDTGLVIGAHACALTVSKGEALFAPGAPKFDASRLSPVQCGR